MFGFGAINQDEEAPQEQSSRGGRGGRGRGGRGN
tara:strand:- start:624 stop:725 length:102 start_codon:yes stop_codon:yes gene_type:complete